MLLTIVLVTTSIYAQTKHEKIKIKMKALEAMIGAWEVKSSYTDRSGSISESVGIHVVSWELDSTYFKWFAKMRNVKTGREREFVSWISYDQEIDQYRQTYLYSGSANQIVELGNVDLSKSMFITTTTLELSDGVTEFLRNEVSFKKPDQMIYVSWAKFDNAPPVNNYQSVMNRKR